MFPEVMDIDNNPKEIYEKYSLLQAKVFPSLYNNNYSISNYRSSSSKIKLGIISYKLNALFPRQDLNIQTIHSSIGYCLKIVLEL